MPLKCIPFDAEFNLDFKNAIKIKQAKISVSKSYGHYTTSIFVVGSEWVDVGKLELWL